jgi:hypothetical protein
MIRASHIFHSFHGNNWCSDRASQTVAWKRRRIDLIAPYRKNKKQRPTKMDGNSVATNGAGSSNAPTRVAGTVPSLVGPS